MNLSLRDTYIATREFTSLAIEAGKPLFGFLMKVAEHYVHDPQKLEDDSYIAKLLFDAFKDADFNPTKTKKIVKGLVGVLGGFGGGCFGTSLELILTGLFPALIPFNAALGMGLNIVCGTLAGEGGKRIVELF